MQRNDAETKRSDGEENNKVKAEEDGEEAKAAV